MLQKYHLAYYLILSFAGLLLVGVLTFFPLTIANDFVWRKPLIGSIFGTICFLGSMAVFSSAICGRVLKKKNENEIPDSAQSFESTSKLLEGHHPVCGRYSAHVFKLKNKSYCAACVGLLFGGMLALIGTLVYFFNGWYIIDNVPIVLVGIFGVTLGFFQFRFRNVVRLFVNTFFVLGALFILIGVDGAVQSLVFDIFVLGLIVFWLLTRIFLSQWDHEVICSSCEAKNCEIKKEKGT